MRNFKSLFGLVFLIVIIVGCETVSQKNSVFSTTAEELAQEDATKKALTVEQSYLIGRDMAAVFVHKYPLVDDDRVTLYLNQVGQSVALHLDNASKNVKCIGGKKGENEKMLPQKGFRFGALKVDERISIALPGGFVFVSLGLLRDVKTEDELAGILAHEATHAVCRDGLKQIEMAAAGVGEEMVEDVERTYQTYFEQSHSVAQVKVADRGALLALYRAGYYPADYIQFVAGQKDRPVLRQPATPNRAAWMKKDFAKMKKKGVVNTQKDRAARFAEFKKLMSL